MRKSRFGCINDMPKRWRSLNKVNDKIYTMWHGMWKRCGNSKYYLDCKVCDEWKYLSNFIKWIECQPNYNNFISTLDIRWVVDKDSLYPGNRIYSPEYCTLMTSSENCKEVVTRCSDRHYKRPCIGIGDTIILSLSPSYIRNFNSSKIHLCCKGHRKTHKGFKWYYVNYKHGRRLRYVWNK